MIAPRRPVTILLVEDDDGDVKAVQRAFDKAKLPYPIRRAIDGIEAMDILRGTNGVEKLEKPYLLLTDVNMPRLSGIKLVRTIRNDPALRDSIVFMLTTSKRQEDKADCYNVNVAGYILKDDTGSDFTKLVAILDAYCRVVEMP